MQHTPTQLIFFGLSFHQTLVKESLGFGATSVRLEPSCIQDFDHLAEEIGKSYIGSRVPSKGSSSTKSESYSQVE